MRYVWYSYMIPSRGWVGNSVIVGEQFPSRAEMELKVQRGAFPEALITSMFEFKSKEDYDSFLATASNQLEENP